MQFLIIEKNKQVVNQNAFTLRSGFLKRVTSTGTLSWLKGKCGKLHGVPCALMLSSSRKHLNLNNCVSRPALVPRGGHLRKPRRLVRGSARSEAYQKGQEEVQEAFLGGNYFTHAL